MEPLIAAIDYETFYSKEYSVKDLGNYGYTHHPEFDAYMISVATNRGDLWVGHPKDFNYADVDGAIWIMANAGFDLAVTDRLIELDIIPKVAPSEVFDVLDLSRYLGFPGNLAGATKHLLGRTMDKGTRDKAKGKHWHEMTAEFQKEMTTYAGGDCICTRDIWLAKGHLWPAHERELSRITREMCRRGVPVDIAGIKKDIRALESLLWMVRTQIPWASDPETPILSKKAMALECRKNGIEPPKSMAKDSEEFDAWLKAHGDDYRWARAMGSYRSINIQLKRLKSMLARTIEGTKNPDEGWMVFGLKYCGAHTLRDSGDMGVNVQNFSKHIMFEKEMREMFGKVDAPADEVFGLDMRGKIMAPEGKLLAVCDLSAIEPCCLAVLAEDWDFVELLKKGMDPYEAWARVHHGFKGSRSLKEVNPKMRDYMKVEVLGLGYGAGSDKLKVMAKQWIGVDLSDSEAQKIVHDFRATKFIPDLWDKLESAMKSSAPGDFSMGLPSGREMVYRDVRSFGSLSAVINRGPSMMRLKFWGGSLCENLIQGSARDVFMDRVLALYGNGFPPILRVHDEAVSLVDESTADDELAKMQSIFATTPDWWPELPVRSDGHLCKRYTKG